MDVVIVVAPHPDDETYGCGGTLLRHYDKGDAIHWLIVTKMSDDEYPREKIIKREHEISEVSSFYNFTSVHQLSFSAAKLEQVPRKNLVEAIGEVFQALQPSCIYLPNKTDIHTDHQVVFDATIACTKWFRYHSIKKIFAYETLSETDFNLNPNIFSYTPNSYINIASYLETKITIAKIYESEFGIFPFPRSEESIRALAKFRGSLSGFSAAEAFILLREFYD